MKTKKNVLIITDGSGEAAAMAAGIAAALKGNKVSIKEASAFKGNDILPADVVFLGCEKPRPASFTYLADLLKHINLAGRPCGIFSPGSEKAVKYLTDLLKDCEAALNPEPLVTSGTDIGSWVQKIVSKSF